MDILVPRKVVNASALAAEMTAAIGTAWQGWSARRTDPDHYSLHVPDGTAQATIDAALAVYAAHDATVLTAAQIEEAARQAARTTLSQADFEAWKTAFNNASTLAAVKPLVWQLARIVWQLAKAQGLVTSNDPGA